MRINSILAADLADNWEFTELWVDPTASPHVLLLLCNSAGNCSIYDPAQSYQTVFTSTTYQDTKLWLLEDEYERVEGQLRGVA